MSRRINWEWTFWRHVWAFDAKVDVKGIENLPKDGLYTFVSNHPLGGQDGVALGYVLGKHYEGKVKYLVNDLLMNLRGLAPFAYLLIKPASRQRTFRRWWKPDSSPTIS